jgi:hypothetical protein
LCLEGCAPIPVILSPSISLKDVGVDAVANGGVLRWSTRSWDKTSPLDGRLYLQFEPGLPHFAHRPALSNLLKNLPKRSGRQNFGYASQTIAVAQLDAEIASNNLRALAVSRMKPSGITFTLVPFVDVRVFHTVTNDPTFLDQVENRCGNFASVVSLSYAGAFVAGGRYYPESGKPFDLRSATELMDRLTQVNNTVTLDAIPADPTEMHSQLMALAPFPFEVTREQLSAMHLAQHPLIYLRK